jgi:hypothetical protein
MTRHRTGRDTDKTEQTNTGQDRNEKSPGLNRASKLKNLGDCYSPSTVACAMAVITPPATVR